MKNSILKSVISSLTYIFLTQALMAENEKPNIIYVIADDLGYGDLSCYGQKNFKTPNLDKMAEAGIRFTDHYSGATVCLPSRVSLMTGKDMGHAYIRGNGDLKLRKGVDITIAHILKDAGYSTAMIGKSCVQGGDSDPEVPLYCGFDYFFGTLSHKTAHHHYSTHVYENQAKIKIKGNDSEKGKTGQVYIHDLYTTKAKEFIKQNQKKSFFLLLSYGIPHADISAPQSVVKQFSGKYKDEISYPGRHYASCKEVKATYAAMVTKLDTYMGDLFKQLNELGISNNTIVCFTSDNGPHYEGGYDPEFHNSNGDLQKGKRSFHEGGIRVPFIVKWPSKIQAGQTSNHSSAFWDFMATMCEITGQKIPDGTQSLSFLSTLLGKKQKSHSHLYWERPGQGGEIALRQGKWKLLRKNINNLKSQAAPSNALYNLEEDIGEKNDLSKVYPEKFEELMKLAINSRIECEIKKWNFKKSSK